MHPNLSTIGVNKTFNQTNFCNSLCDNKLETLQGSKKTWIPTCPLGKQLSHVSSLGLLQVLLILVNDFVRGWLVWALTLWASEHNCEDHSSVDFISAVLLYDLFHIHWPAPNISGFIALLVRGVTPVLQGLWFKSRWSPEFFQASYAIS